VRSFCYEPVKLCSVSYEKCDEQNVLQSAATRDWLACSTTDAPLESSVLTRGMATMRTRPVRTVIMRKCARRS